MNALPRTSPSIVLAAYLESLVHGRRVALLGDATTGLGAALAERGARLVHAYDPDAARISEALARRSTQAKHAVSYAVLDARAPDGDLGVRDGAFDVVVVPDLTLFADPGDTLRRARRLVGPAGTAVIVSPNGEAKSRLIPSEPAHAPPSYYELYDLVALQFGRVKMVGQAPFVGYAIADFAPDGEPEVSVDTSLLEASEEPEHFIAIASDRTVEIEAYSVVELALDDLDLGRGAPTADDLEDRVALTEARARLGVVSAELEAMRERQRETERRAAEAEAAGAQVVELEAELERTRAKIADVDKRAGDTHVRAERLTHQIRDLEEELVRQRDRGTKLSKLVDDEKKQRTKAEVELGMLRGNASGGKERIEALATELEQAKGRIAELELEGAETLRRGALRPLPDPMLEARVAELEVALATAERRALAIASERDEARRGAERDRLALEERIAAAEQRAESFERRAVSAEQRLAARDQEAASAPAETEVAALEARLLDRGRAIAALERDLRESERIGRELVDELMTARAEAAASSGDGGGEGGDAAEGGEEAAKLRSQLDTLAASAAKSEADLQAAVWRISQLERDVADSSTRPDPTDVQLELERALAAAHDELAALRRSSRENGA